MFSEVRESRSSLSLVADLTLSQYSAVLGCFASRWHNVCCDVVGNCQLSYKMKEVSLHCQSECLDCLGLAHNVPHLHAWHIQYGFPPQDVIRMMMTQAHNHLEDLRRSLALAGC